MNEANRLTWQSIVRSILGLQFGLWLVLAVWALPQPARADFSSTEASTISWFYAAAFGRTPVPNSAAPNYGDLGGLAFWTDAYLTGAGGLAPFRGNVYAIADFFVTSDEFQAKYPASLTNEAFIIALYDNMLGRAADEGGLAFWVGQLSAGASRGTVLADFTNTPENQNSNPLRKAALESFIAFIDADADGTITPAEAAVWLAANPTLDGVRVDHAFDPIQLPQTGQQACYSVDGAFVDCAGTGQDGAIRAGVEWPEPRFRDNGDGTLTDELTGLMWLKNANCIATRYPEYDTWNPSYWNPGDRVDGAVPWNAALAFVAGINDGTYPNCGAGYADWRMPNFNELESLLNMGWSSPGQGEYRQTDWLTTQGFENIGQDALALGGAVGYYWSSTVHHRPSGAIWTLVIRNRGDDGTTSQHLNLNLLPVRDVSRGPAQVWQTGRTDSLVAGDDGALRAGAPWPKPRFLVGEEAESECVTDRLTGLMWSRRSETAMNWQGALDYLNGLRLCGHADWRLPNRKEMLSLVHRGWDEGGYGGGVYGPVDWLNRQGFESVIGGFHWTSTTCLPRPGSRHAWRLSFSNGRIDCDTWAEKSYQYPVLPVRTVDMGHEDSLLNSTLGLTH